MSVKWVGHEKRGLGCFVVLFGLATIACTGPDPSVDALATDSLLPQQDLETTEVQRPHPAAHSDDPFSVFSLEPGKDAEATSRITPVWMINHSAQSVVVSGRGGAASVVLDTIGSTDSVLVRIETRARTVVLEALAAGRVSLGTVVVPMDSEPKRVAFPQ